MECRPLCGSSESIDRHTAAAPRPPPRPTMAQAAFGRAFVAAGGTLLVLGGATLGLSFVTMTITRIVVDQQKKKQLIACRCCSGRTKLPCDICSGERVLRYHPSATVPVNQRVSQSACAMCEGTGDQVCLNCLGEGQVMPLAGGLQECIRWLDAPAAEAPPPVLPAAVAPASAARGKGPAATGQKPSGG